MSKEPDSLTNLSRGIDKTTLSKDTEFPQLDLRKELNEAESASGTTVFSQIEGMKKGEYYDINDDKD